MNHIDQKPINIRFHKKQHQLELVYAGDNPAENQCYQLSAEFLRVHSPSAEVTGHGKEVLQTGKKNVNVTDIKPVGNYAIQLYFDDRHSTGIYSWGYLYELCQNQSALWQAYLHKLEQANASREPFLIASTATQTYTPKK